MQDRPETDPAASVVQVVAVRFRSAGRVYRYDAGPLLLHRGDRVIVQSERGTNLGTVIGEPRPVPGSTLHGALPRVIKTADPRDLAREEANIERARDAQRVCARRIRERRLPMKLIKAEPVFDGSKIVIYFFAEDRVDFRELVRDLSQALHTRVEMKQIGPRDETKMVGGLGPCGRELCCTSWLHEFSAVSVKMAKEQSLALNPSKLAGMCGRLKCCLRYEYDTYVELGRSLPRVGAKVDSVKGKGVVTRQNLFKQTVMIRGADDVDVEVSLVDLVLKKKD